METFIAFPEPSVVPLVHVHAPAPTIIREHIVIAHPLLLRHRRVEDVAVVGGDNTRHCIVKGHGSVKLNQIYVCNTCVPSAQYSSTKTKETK